MLALILAGLLQIGVHIGVGGIVAAVLAVVQIGQLVIQIVVLIETKQQVLGEHLSPEYVSNLGLVAVRLKNHVDILLLQVLSD